MLAAEVQVVAKPFPVGAPLRKTDQGGGYGGIEKASRLLGDLQHDTPLVTTA